MEFLISRSRRTPAPKRTTLPVVVGASEKEEGSRHEVTRVTKKKDPLEVHGDESARSARRKAREAQDESRETPGERREARRVKSAKRTKKRSTHRAY